MLFGGNVTGAVWIAPPSGTILPAVQDVDLALILAFDGSASVTYDEFGLIAGGCAAAFRDPDVIRGLLHGPRRASLCAVLLWSGPQQDVAVVDWTRLGAEADVARFADRVDNVARVVPPGTTAIGDALAACEGLLARLPAAAGRRVIDVAGDGRSNDGPRPEPVRERLIAAGVVINGLCVLHEEADLLESYQREVVGGEGGFALTCADYAGFARAMRQKLVLEVAAVTVRPGSGLGLA